MADTKAFECWNVIFVLDHDDPIPRVDMCVTGIGTSLTNNSGVEFTINNHKLSATEFDANKPFNESKYNPVSDNRMLVHRADYFKIDRADAYPVYIHARMYPGSYVPAAIKTGKFERWMEVEKILDEVTR